MKQIIRISVFLAVLLAAACFDASAKVTLPSFFSDNMVFQAAIDQAMEGLSK